MMRLTLVLGLGFVVAAIGWSAVADEPSLLPEFKSFTPADGQFTIKFPGTPTDETETAETKVGKVTVHTFSVAPKKSGEEFMVIVSEVDQKYRPDYNFEKAMDDGRDRIVKALDGRLAKEEKITLGDSPGRDLTIELGDKANSSYRWRLFYVGQRQYQLVAGATGHPVAEQRAKQFFDSFKLLEKLPEAKAKANAEQK